MATEIRIIRVKESVSKNFIFETGEVKSLGQPQVSQEARLSFPKDNPNDPTEDFVVSLGVKQEINFSWKLYKEDNDRSEGTDTSINTYEEMLNYLEDIIAYPGVGLVYYELTIISKFRTRTYKCTLEDYNVDVDSGIYPTGNFKFSIKKEGT